MAVISLAGHGWASQCRRSAAVSSAARSSGKNSRAPSSSTTSVAPGMVSRSQYAHLRSKKMSPVPQTMRVGTGRRASAGSTASRSRACSEAISRWYSRAGSAGAEQRLAARPARSRRAAGRRPGSRCRTTRWRARPVSGPGAARCGRTGPAGRAGPWAGRPGGGRLSCASQLVSVRVCSRSGWPAANTCETAPPVSLATRSTSASSSASQQSATKRARPGSEKSWPAAAGRLPVQWQVDGHAAALRRRAGRSRCRHR